MARGRKVNCDSFGYREAGDVVRGNRKDRDIGYALAANSCEGASDVDACTIAVLDAITAFAAPGPGVTSQKRRFFRVRPSSGSPRLPNHPAYIGLATIFEANPFSRRRCENNSPHIEVNARCWCNSKSSPQNFPHSKTLFRKDFGLRCGKPAT